MKKPIKKHKDQNFVYGMNRYLCSGFVTDSESWEELFEKLRKYNFQGFKNQSFNEYKLFNLIIEIEYRLATILELFFKEDKLNKDGAYVCVLETCKRYRALDREQAAKILKKEMESNPKNLFSPHILFYIAGCSLGDILNIFDQYTIDFSHKDKIVKQLRGFNNKRNDFTHNLLSSRTNQHKLLLRALLTGMKLKKAFDQMIEAGFVVGISGREGILKLKI